MMVITQVESDEQAEAARVLFREYEAWFGVDLCFQQFDEEVAGLPGKYVPPEGRLLLAYVDDAIAGCVALRRLDDEICEMKRLYLREAFRGQGVGVKLLERLIDEAREIGYRKMRLDTFKPKMGKAIELYRSHGFYEIPKYYDNPHEHVLFMELDLQTATGAAILPHE